MKKMYLEIGSSVGAVLAFIFLIVVINMQLPAYASYGSVALLLLFILTVGFIGIRLAEIKD